MKKILLSIFLLGTLISVNAQVPSYVPSNGLVGWWPFSGNANDQSGSGNNGTVNGATLSNDRFANSNSAYNFDGINNYISMNSMNNIPMGSNSRSISIWMNPSSLSTNWTWTGISYGSAVNSKAFMFGLGLKSINVQAWVDDFGSVLNYSAGQWIHAVCTYDGSTIKIYVDGILIGSGTKTTWNTFGTEFYFGARPSKGNSFFPGKLDDIGIWNRALDSNEVKLLFKGCDRKITQQPINISTSNKKVSFTCQANDTLQTYQWQILNNSIWTNLKDSAQFAGTKSNQLTVNQLLASNNGQKFRCNVSGKCINASSNIATLNYNCKGDIVKQPSNQGMFAGNATFTCATNDTLVNYQWQTNSGTGWNNLFNAGQYSGTTSNSLLVSNVTLSNNNQLFRCIIKGDCLTDTTSEVSLRVWGLGVQSEQVQAFKVYPNPTKGQVTIENGDIAKMIGYAVSIYNSIGQQVFQSNITQQQFSLDISQLGGNGLYFMELTDNNGNIVDVKKIVLQ